MSAAPPPTSQPDVRPYTQLYEDADLVAIDKPAGIVVIPGRQEAAELSLQKRLEAQRRERLWVVHRLDRDTSGVVIFARNPAAHRALNQAFETRRVDKTYRALVAGEPEDRGLIELPLRPARRNRMRVAVAGDADAVTAVTRYAVERRLRAPIGPVALVVFHPETGRQHQLRVHARALGWPLCGDPLYSPDEVQALAPRLCLHAAALVVPKPGDGSRLSIEAPWPADLAALVEGWAA